MKLKDKVAIITGASSGMGRASALLFAKEGAKVVVADFNEHGGRETVEMIKKDKGTAIFVKTDVSKENEVTNLIASALREFGKIDIMFNNAGVLSQHTVTETSEQELNRVLDINLKGVFYGCKHALAEMIKRKSGVIINTASIAGIVGFTGLAAYCASKGGIIALTRATALDYAKYGIRVNCICPGAVDTPMVRSFVEGAPDPKAALAGMAAMQPIGRIGKPEDIASAALFLASEESSFITGHSLIVDGGTTAQ